MRFYGYTLMAKLNISNTFSIDKDFKCFGWCNNRPILDIIVMVPCETVFFVMDLGPLPPRVYEVIMDMERAGEYLSLHKVLSKAKKGRRPCSSKMFDGINYPGTRIALVVRAGPALTISRQVASYLKWVPLWQLL